MHESLFRSLVSFSQLFGMLHWVISLWWHSNGMLWCGIRAPLNIYIFFFLPSLPQYGFCSILPQYCMIILNSIWINWKFRLFLQKSVFIHVEIIWQKCQLSLLEESCISTSCFSLCSCVLTIYLLNRLQSICSHLPRLLFQKLSCPIHNLKSHINQN